MRYLRFWTLLLVVSSSSSLATSRADTLVISEFMALNNDTLVDQDGDFSDWIELYNAGPAAVDLEGWALTDDASTLDKWKLPALSMQPKTFLLVFASGKDLTDPAGELHTNFRLSGEGEYLGLVDPAGLIASEFKPEFERQVPYASYGINMGSDVLALVPEGATARYHVPTDDTLGLSWVETDFDAAGWDSGPTGIGFDDNSRPVFTDLIMTDILEKMRRVNSSVYIRLPFVVEDPASISALLLQARYEDGMVIWLNGRELERLNLRDDIAWDARAERPRQDDEALTPEQINLSAGLDALVAGQNVLAIQLLNTSDSNADVFLLPVLQGLVVGDVKPDAREYFPAPSPRWPNSGGVPAIAEDPQFSRGSGAFTEVFALELTSTAAEIRYTLDGSEVTRSSTLYEGPIDIDGTMIVRARSYEDGLLPSPIVEVSYVVFDPELLDVSSNLPIVVVNTFGNGRIAGNCNRVYFPGHIMIIERGEDGRARITDEPHYIGNIGLRPRGASTCGRQKNSMNIEFRDESGEDLDVEVLGFPKESDFALYGAYNFDQALIRNAFIYEISNQCDRWAPRTRPVEVYLNETRGGPVRAVHYWGVYSFMERIKQGPDRVDIAELNPEHDAEPEITGGYIFKIDRNQENEPTVPAGAGGSVVIEYPKDITAAQRQYLQRYLAQMEAALRRPDPLELGRDFIDVDAWIDHHILMTFPKNVDAFRLSGYFYKDRDGKVGRGPIWDYDRTMGSTDGRDRDPDTWQNNGGDGGTRYFTNDWWSLLFKGRAVDAAGPPPLGDDEFAVRYRARWRELRAGPLATDNLLGVIQGMADEIGESAERNWNKWRQGSRDYSVPVNQLKNWIAERVAWIDSQFIDPPSLSEPGGLRTEPFDLEISVVAGDIYYTVNGPDPRLANGNPHPEAVKYSGPIRVDKNTRVWARARVGGAWSEDVSDSYYFELAPLVVTEVMYNPATDTDHEFVEFLNVGTRPLDLTGVRLVESRAGVERVLFDFTGSDITALAPGEYALAVNDRAEFTALYGEGLPVAGEIDRSLSNTSMFLRLLGPVDEPLLEFEYDDDWDPTTDGNGYSLVIRDPHGPREAWADGASWRASLEMGGSPGRADGDQPAPGLQIAGDINQDRDLNVTDAIGILRQLFQGGVALPCASEAANNALLDMNGDAAVNITDVVHTLAYLFQSGAPPALGSGCVPIEGCPSACE